MQIEMKPRSFGEILDGGFQIFRRHFLVLGLTTLIPSGIAAIATLALMSSMLSSGPAGPSPALGLAFVPIWLLAMGLQAIVWGALTWQTSEACTGGPVTVPDGLRAGVRSLLRLVGAGLLSYLATWIGLMVVLVPFGIVAAIAIPMLAAGGGGGTAAGVVMAIVGVAMGIGMLVAIMAVAGYLVCVGPAVVVEGLGPIRAISRAMDLARGAVLRSGGVVVVAAIIAVLPTLAMLFLTGQFTAVMRPGSAPPSTAALFVQQLGGLAVSAFTMPFLAAVITVLYYDRRVRTEALDVHLAARGLADAQPVAP